MIKTTNARRLYWHASGPSVWRYTYSHFKAFCTFTHANNMRCIEEYNKLIYTSYNTSFTPSYYHCQQCLSVCHEGRRFNVEDFIPESSNRKGIRKMVRSFASTTFTRWISQIIKRVGFFFRRITRVYFIRRFFHDINTNRKISRLNPTVRGDSSFFTGFPSFDF